MAILLAILAARRGNAAEIPQEYLHCRSKDPILTLEHEVVLYADRAEVDDLPYAIESKPDSFVLDGPIRTVADQIEPPSKMVINRITGAYLIVQRGEAIISSEAGYCIKVKPKF